MKKQKQKRTKLLFLSVSISLLSGLFLLNSLNTTAETTTNAEDTTQKRPSYEESEDPLNENPERGFYRTATLKLAEVGNKPQNPKSDISSLLWTRVDLSDFSGAQREDGTDKELTSDAISALNETLENIKQNNQSTILRFVYDKNGDGIKEDEGKLDANGNRYVEPSVDMIVKHIKALKPTFEKYKNTIFIIQMGFFGDYGELHGTPMCTQENYNKVLDALFDATSETSIQIAVRTTSQYFEYAKYKNPATEAENFSELEDGGVERLTIYDDGYLGNDTDLGTYTNREAEVESMPEYFGGEAVVNADPALKIDGLEFMNKYSLIGNLEKEAGQTHTTYLNYEWNQNLHNEWKKIKYDGADEKYKNFVKADGSDYSDYDYIQAHLGYRRLLTADNTFELDGDTLRVSHNVEELGFGSLPSDKYEDSFVFAKTDGSLTKVIPDGETIPDVINLKDLGLTSGTYRVYFRTATNETLSDGTPYLPVRYANKGIWNDKLKANFLGEFDYKTSAEPAKTATETTQNTPAEPEQKEVEQIEESDETPDEEEVAVPDTSGAGKVNPNASVTIDAIVLAVFITSTLFSVVLIIKKI